MNHELVILSLIKVHPDVSGYQLKSIVDKSSGHIAQIHLSKIYPLLKKMTKEGLLTYRSVKNKGRLDQKFYSLTEKGQKTLDEYLMQPFEFGPNRSCFDEYMLQIGGMAYLDNERICSFIDEGVVYLDEEIEFRQGENIAVDEEFLVNTDEDLKERYRKLWNVGRTYMLNEAKARRKALLELKQEYM